MRQAERRENSQFCAEDKKNIGSGLGPVVSDVCANSSTRTTFSLSPQNRGERENVAMSMEKRGKGEAYVGCSCGSWCFDGSAAVFRKERLNRLDNAISLRHAVKPLAVMLIGAPDCL